MHPKIREITRTMAKSSVGKPATNGSKSSTGKTGSNPFPGGNWPSKVPGAKSGSNRGQGPKG